MTYIKIGQISDVAQHGLVYTEIDSHSVVTSQSPVFPLQVNVEVIDWGSQATHDTRGHITSYTNVQITVPDTSVSIRQSVYNQLVGTYPSLVM